MAFPMGQDTPWMVDSFKWQTTSRDDWRDTFVQMLFNYVTFFGYVIRNVRPMPEKAWGYEIFRLVEISGLLFFNRVVQIWGKWLKACSGMYEAPLFYLWHLLLLLRRSSEDNAHLKSSKTIDRDNIVLLLHKCIINLNAYLVKMYFKI